MSRCFLYHWTHRNNLPSILVEGLDPSYSEGKLAAVWVCSAVRINWALWHVATRHGWNPDDMVLIRIAQGHIDVKRTCQPAVFNVSHVIRPNFFRGVRSDPVAGFPEDVQPAECTQTAGT